MVNVSEIRSEQGGSTMMQRGGTVVDSHHPLHLQACDTPDLVRRRGRKTVISSLLVPPSSLHQKKVNSASVSTL
ncbi:hypothetical protein KY289_017224 [Solanum tuberosum]|nr:hypothetical protein KY289_017224 [Solanum tuberosum]